MSVEGCKLAVSPSWPANIVQGTEATMTTAIDVASYISAHENTWLDNRSLQKLVYFSQGWTLGWTGRPLFDGDFEAWPDGPVDRPLWVCQRYSFVPKYEGQLTSEQSEIVNAVLDHYRGRQSRELVDLSHEAVWEEARSGLPAQASSRNRLDPSTMRRYYVTQAIAGEGPSRAPSADVVPADSAAIVANDVIARWKEGLDLLATR
jgi:uncharacterized phage-associated protein